MSSRSAAKGHALRDDLIDRAQSLIQAKGYESMSVQDLLDDVGVSKGAFYHYFDSKDAVLEAVVERMVEGSAANLKLIVERVDLSATEKLQRFWSTTMDWKSERIDLMFGLLQVWDSDDNAVVRARLRRAADSRIVPLLAQVIVEGAEAGLFDTEYPEETAHLAAALVSSMGETIGAQLLSRQATGDPDEAVVLRTPAAYSDALERILGAAEGSLSIVSEEALRAWL